MNHNGLLNQNVAVIFQVLTKKQNKTKQKSLSISSVVTYKQQNMFIHFFSG
jgi:hypothetical protein